MRTIKRRLLKLETRAGRGHRPLRVIRGLLPEELTDLELEACIQGCEPWQVKEELIRTKDEIHASIMAKIAAAEARAKEEAEIVYE